MRTMQRMAGRSVPDIRTVHPAGPYLIAGWSLSGILAYEIATKLIGNDKSVKFVALFDANYSVRKP